MCINCDNIAWDGYGIYRLHIIIVIGNFLEQFKYFSLLKLQSDY